MQSDFTNFFSYVKTTNYSLMEQILVLDDNIAILRLPDNIFNISNIFPSLFVPATAHTGLAEAGPT